MDIIIKTRRRFMTLMMFVVTVITAAALGAVYFITYSTQEAGSRRRLDSQEEVRITDEAIASINEDASRTVVMERTYVDMGISFSVLADGNGKIITILSNISDLPLDIYGTAVNIARQGENYSETELEGRWWKYIMTPASTDFELAYEFEMEIPEQAYLIRFIDITESRQTLVTLAFTLGTIGVSLMIFFFLFSLFFSKRAVAPLAEVLEKQRQFIADASHELKTPVSIIKANCSVLYANEERSVLSQREWLEGIVTGANRMASLIQGLLALSKIEGSDSVPVKSEVIIEEEIEDALDLFSLMINEKNLTVEKDCGFRSINSSPDKFRQVLEIVLDNAIKYSEEGGRIRISTAKEKKWCCLSVFNTGDGIPKDELEKIFNRFYRAETARTQDGSYGLGLSIARTVMGQLGGSINAESVLGESTTFMLRFPLK